MTKEYYCLHGSEIMELFHEESEDTPCSFAEVGDEVIVFNGERLIPMTIDVIERREYTLVDAAGYRYLGSPWVKSNIHGTVFKTKNSMASKLANDWVKNYEVAICTEERQVKVVKVGCDASVKTEYKTL